jgi:hypothetical protein
MTDNAKIAALHAKCDALAGALRAHEQHMGEAQHTCVRYLVPAADPIRIEKEQFVSEMLGHFDGPEQRAVQEKANAALAAQRAMGLVLVPVDMWKLEAVKDAYAQFLADAGLKNAPSLEHLLPRLIAAAQGGE